MAKHYVSVIFDRKKKASITGTGLVEVRIYLDRNVRKYIVVGTTTKSGWKNYQKSRELCLLVEKYESIVQAMKLMGEDMTIENFNSHACDEQEKKAKKENKLKRSFIEFMRDELSHEDIREGTRRHKLCVINSILSYGKIKTFADLTPANIRAYDRWLHETGERTDVTVWGYHKRLRTFTHILKMNDLIPMDPYDQCKFNHGRSKARTPLIESELVILRELELEPKLDRVRDLFIFSAYTGMSYIDVQNFNFKRMSQKIGDMYFIEGTRFKTNTNYYTPILKPAMDVLLKYNFRLPSISNQKANDYLHVIETIMGLHKNLTFHLARHSFATLALSHGIPIENVSKMLGHTDIKTTQIYCKILNDTVQRYSNSLNASIL